MMNRSSSAEAFVPSMMYFAGLEGSSQKHHIWDWETSSHNPNTTIPSTNNNLQNHTFFPSAPFLDCPPPLLPMNSLPFYAPPPLPEYPMELMIKREDSISGCSRIGLNLGHRTYFSSGDALTIDQLFTRSRGVYGLSSQSPRCQAEGCKADLSGAKHYHRRHKVCEFHSKATVVIVGGLQQRFCQQCSRFHVLAEFDEAKRSCRKRLADHNRRRRKPQAPTTTTESSASKNTNTNSSEKDKKSENTTTKSTDAICASTNASTKVSGEGQQYHNKENPLRNGPALSLGGVAAEKGGTGPNTMMYIAQGPFATVAEEKVSQQQHSSSSPSAFNSTYFHHHNLFCSSSHEPSYCSGGGSGQSTSDHQYHQSDNPFHPGQALFEVDYM